MNEKRRNRNNRYPYRNVNNNQDERITSRAPLSSTRAIANLSTKQPEANEKNIPTQVPSKKPQIDQEMGVRTLEEQRKEF